MANANTIHLDLNILAARGQPWPNNLAEHAGLSAECGDCHMPIGWHFPDTDGVTAESGYVHCPCAECARAPATVYDALDCYGTRGDVCEACATLPASERSYTPQRRKRS